MGEKPWCAIRRALQREDRSTAPLDALDDYRVSAARYLLPAEDLHRGNPTLSIGDRAKIEQDDPIFRAINQCLDSTREANAVFSPERARENTIL